MARKLSIVARPISDLVVAAAVSLAATASFAEFETAAADSPQVISNPFSDKPQPTATATVQTLAPAPAASQQQPPQPVAQAQLRPKSVEQPQQSERTQTVAEPKPKNLRRQIAYQNPFAATSKAPPVDTSLRPGPISRWRHPVIPGSDQTAVKSAVLSAPSVQSGEPKWDVLPLGETLRTQAAAHSKETDPTFYSRLTNSASPIQFSPKPLAQPNWLTEYNEMVMSQPRPEPVHVDAAIFSVPPSTTDYATPVAAVDHLPAVPPAGPLQQPLEQDAADANLARADVAPSIVSNCVESPEGWLEQAQNAAQNADTPDELSAVVEFCDRGMRGGPDEKQSNSLRRLSAWACNRRGEMLADSGRDEDALSDFQTAISLDPSCSLAIHNRAVTLAQQNQFTAALRDFNRVIELNPGLAVAYRNRAELLAALGRTEEAIADYNQAIDNLPNDAQLYRDRAYAYQQLGEFARALIDFNRAIDIAPDDADALTQRGNLAAEQGNYEQAVADFQQAIDKNGNWAEAHRSLAWLEATCPVARFQNPHNAIVAAEQALKMGPANDYLIFDTLAAAHASAGHFDEAAQFQQKALSAAPTDAVQSLKERLALYEHRQAFRNVAAPAVEAMPISEANAGGGPGEAVR